MKHLKKFNESIEDAYKDCYWTIPNDERYIKSLQDINCTNKSLYNPQENKNDELYKYTKNKNNQFINICLQKISFDDSFVDDWSWMPYDDDGYLDKFNFKFKGYINIDPSELIANKYNL